MLLNKNIGLKYGIKCKFWLFLVCKVNARGDVTKVFFS